FSEGLLQVLLETAASRTNVEEDKIILRLVYAMRKVTPLDIYLRDANVPMRMRARAVLNLGYTIKGILAAGFFPADLFTTNYGRSLYGRVLLYDYDDLEDLLRYRVLNKPKLRDEDEGLIDEAKLLVEAPYEFYPEKIRDYMVPTFPKELQDLFIQMHGDLLDPNYWRAIQEKVRKGEVLDFYPYPEERRLRPQVVTVRSEVRPTQLSSPQIHFAGESMVQAWPHVALSQSAHTVYITDHMEDRLLELGEVDKYLAEKDQEEQARLAKIRTPNVDEESRWNRWRYLRDLFSNEDIRRAKQMVDAAIEFLEAKAKKLLERDWQAGAEMLGRINRLTDSTMLIGMLMPTLFFYSYLEEGAKDTVVDLSEVWGERSQWDLRKTWISYRRRALFIPIRWLMVMNPRNTNHVAILASGLYKGQFLIDRFHERYDVLDFKTLSDEEYLLAVRDIYREINELRGHDIYGHKENEEIIKSAIFEGAQAEAMIRDLRKWIEMDQITREVQGKKIEKESDSVLLDAVALDQKIALKREKLSHLMAKKEQAGKETPAFEKLVRQIRKLMGEINELLTSLQWVARELEQLARHYDLFGKTAYSELFFNDAARIYKRYQEIDDRAFLPIQNQYRLLLFLLRVGLWKEFMEEFENLLTGKAFQSPGLVIQNFLLDWLDRDIPHFLYKLEVLRAIHSGFPEKQQEIDEVSHSVIAQYRKMKGEVYESVIPGEGPLTTIDVVVGYGRMAYRKPAQKLRAGGVKLIQTKIENILRRWRKEGTVVTDRIQIRLEYFFEDSGQDAVIHRVRRGGIHLLIVGKEFFKSLESSKELTQMFKEWNPSGFLWNRTTAIHDISLKTIEQVLEMQIFGRKGRFSQRSEIRTVPSSDESKLTMPIRGITSDQIPSDLATHVLQPEVRRLTTECTRDVLRERFRYLFDIEVFRAMVRVMLTPNLREGKTAIKTAHPIEAGNKALTEIRIKPERLNRAMRMLGIKSTLEMADGYIIGPGIVLDYGGLPAIRKLFRGKPLVVLAQPVHKVIIERYNQEVLIPKKRIPIPVADNVAEAIELLKTIKPELNRVRPRHRFRICGVLGTPDLWLAEALKDRIGDNIIVITQNVFSRMVKVAKLDRIINDFRREFYVTRSA
ncbi:MAG: bifunctional isocitrate dehydrogenase kinase/phosphatase, partial [Candidatus Omnitrophica bacterium]|nr:bifunctional isocitrate dehydrogenase kinase/phosphatase [Candidatus Omnitrophota bacterium]